MMAPRGRMVEQGVPAGRVRSRGRGRGAAAVAACVLSLVASSREAAAQPYDASPLVVSARQLLPRDMLSGPLFRVDPEVPVPRLLGEFTLRSDLGVFTVPGRDLLRIRIAELSAIQHLEATSKTDVFLSAAAGAATRPLEAAASMVTNPVGTVEGLPGGISRFFDRVEAGAQAIAGAAEDASKSSTQRAQATAERVGSATITALGYEQVRRQLARGLSVDPYTTNPVLAKKLTDVAWVSFSGRLGVEALVSTFVPGSMAISATSFTHDLVYDTPSADLVAMNRDKMLGMGATAAQAEALLGNRWYSLTVLSSLVGDVERLGRVKGRPEVIALAATATSEEEARFFAMSARLLARLHVTGVPLRAVAARGTLVGITSSGGLAVPAPVDYLAWTERIARFAARPDLRAAHRTVWLTGNMSALAQRGFARHGWSLYEAPALSVGW